MAVRPIACVILLAVCAMSVHAPLRAQLPATPTPASPGSGMTAPATPAAAGTRTSAPDQAQEEDAGPLRLRILAAEDARAGTAAELAPILEGLKSRDAETQRVAVRALGRLERSALLDTIAPMLLMPSPEVRAAAADAVAQSVMGGQEVARASALLLDRLSLERHPVVRGAIAMSIGRLAYTSPEEVARAEDAIAGVAFPPDAPGGRATAAVLVGALRGLESLTRLQGKTHRLSDTLAATLRAYVAPVPTRSTDAPAAFATTGVEPLLRRLAFSALVAGGAADEGTVNRAFGSFDEQLRRLAVQAMARRSPIDPAPLQRALRADRSALVRYEALRQLSQTDSPPACGTVLPAVADPSTHVALLAIDTLPRACPSDPAAAKRLSALVANLTMTGTSWHRPAHALVALATLAPDAVAAPLQAAAKDANPFVRMYAARAAAATRDVALLRALAGDADHNTCAAALTGLAAVASHDADDAFVAALGRDDEEVLITASKALAGTPRRDDAARALVEALDRVTAQRRETSRDARLALIDRLAEVAAPAMAERLRPLVNDFDPKVASRAAELLTRWTGATVAPSPRPLARAPLPTSADLSRLGQTRVTIRLRGGGEFDLRFYAAEAPLNAWRFLQLAEAGAYNGLTIHRVVPNLVWQGGSPHANEYSGHGAFTRDEVGVQSNLLGTVGVSTRGRDTGDGQFYLNLADNFRFDHTYTVFATVDRGLEVAQDVLEGTVIEKIVTSSSAR